MDSVRRHGTISDHSIKCHDMLLLLSIIMHTESMKQHIHHDHRSHSLGIAMYATLANKSPNLNRGRKKRDEKKKTPQRLTGIPPVQLVGAKAADSFFLL